MSPACVIQLGPKSMASVLIRDRRGGGTDTEERAGIGVTQSLAKELLGPLETRRGKDRFFPRAFGRGAACLCFDFDLLACRILSG